ncbi:alpha/beta fold hydrolase [Saccharomonospora glauca]|mgnify:CR=1 FL=1|uniref:Putative hydrolase or acyltransferase of alpha/beta superfamily n=1 Tax=Saccharomonospora glauca K62 TaxID=928724 RepID=I1D2V6_9PSEU|nr:alpha/beta hydrolase [Saccharomonospora glauca]EIE99280.1 putative hydrolase or acyltransferase of alpha/beta superfamily [Saccharomonospora glauca K62]
MPAELSETETSRFVETASGKIHFNEAGSGHPIVFLHGSGPGATGWSNFSPNLPVLAEEYRVIAPDMPGWGKSDPVTYEERDHVSAAVHLLDALGIEKATFVGNSMGGATSLKVAARHPDRVSHVVTMGAGAPGPRIFSPGGGPSEGLKILHEGYRNPSPEIMRKLVDIMTFDPAFATEELARQRYENAIGHPDHLANFAAGLGRPRRGEASVEELATIGAPVLIVHGRDDRVVHYEAGLRLVSIIENSRLVLLNRCGHWAQLEHAAEFNRLVRDFVANN